LLLKKEILVIGESCRDIFTYCDAVRLAPDIPVPVLNLIAQEENPGMAKNVYRNIKNINPNCSLITNSNWYDITKTRFVHNDSNHMFFRVDNTLSIDKIDLETIEYDYDIIVISDYNKGFLAEQDIEYISSNHPNVFLDTKKKLGDWSRFCKYIKINDFEFSNSYDFISNNKDIESKVIRTKGRHGCYFNGTRFPVKEVEVKDSSGAGDSFMAGLAIKYAETKDIIQSIIYANKKASEVVTKKGVNVIC
jgi:D-beta-D-heptose 7-phosphate kinase/D-beta-D-heptose 1-phosphate adenosyltransferase